MNTTITFACFEVRLIMRSRFTQDTFFIMKRKFMLSIFLFYS